VSIWEDMLNRLTDAYNKAKTSNIGKLLQLAADELVSVELALREIERQRDIDEAEGYTLERIGRNVKELRGGNDDNDYRDFIKTKIRANLSAGEIETINEVTTVFVGDSFKSVRETWGFGPLDPIDPEPAGVLITITDSPQLILSTQAINRVVAGGVRVYWLIELTPAFVGVSSFTAQGKSTFDYTAMLYSGPFVDNASVGSLESSNVNINTLGLAGAPEFNRISITCGVLPVVSSLGSLEPRFANITSVANAFSWLYPQTGDNYSGTLPFIFVPGSLAEKLINIDSTPVLGVLDYPKCGAFYCGEEVA